MHFTPTHASWMNLVEVWFGIVERQAIRRGVFKSVKDLNAKIRAFIDGWNDRAHPFVWTKTAEQVLNKANLKGLQMRGTSPIECDLLHVARPRLITGTHELVATGAELPCGERGGALRLSQSRRCHGTSCIGTALA